MSNPQSPDYPALLRRSLVAIEQLESKLAAAEAELSEPIAILGMACRFPGDADTPAAYWELLVAGRDAVTEVPPTRWDVDAVFDPDPDVAGKTYTRWGGFISQVDGFDAAFFGVSPREATSLDPQQRLLLEVTWEALEHAGIAPSSIAGSNTGVYVGMSTHDYAMEFTAAGGLKRSDAYTASGSSHSIASGRLSYFLDLHGPNFPVDTACSSSLVAIHSAIQSLRRREASLALAGGVSLTLTPVGAILTSRARMMSFDGRCKAFDTSADGYVRSEGCGMLVLKRLSDAQRDGDRVLALIRGSALNQDGRSSGLTAPNGAAQEAVIRAALANARLSPTDISVVEAHGTGTSFGDPIEMNALGRVFGQRDPQRPLIVGSVKTNIGHTEGAAGVAGMIKTVLSLQHQVVPPHLHLRDPNPLIPWTSLPIRIPTALTPWEAPDGAPRRAGVSSFGFSGTNAHVVFEEAPSPVDVPARRNLHAAILPLSAQTAAAVKDLAARFQVRLERSDAPAWEDLVLTAGQGRSHLPERLAIVADSTTDAATQLAAFVEGRINTRIARGRASSSTSPEIAFLFTGQGAQYVGMARELYASQPVFTQALDGCAAIVDPLLERPLVAVMMGHETCGDLLDDTAYTQPALFAVEYALAQLWRSWGVEPTIVMGHSIGEYVAACIAGVFSLEDGLRLIAHRGRLMSGLPRSGTMAAVFADEARVCEALRGFEREATFAAVNGPENTVISGLTSSVEAVLATLAAQGIESQRLNVSHAFHSPLMEPMLDEFERIAGGVAFSPPRIGLVSNVTGRMAGAEVASAAYWRRHVREAVRFADGIATLHAEKIRTFVELGPSPTLLRMAQRCPGGSEGVWLPSLKKGVGDLEAMLQALAQLYVHGQRIDWRGLAGETARRTELPSYPFQRERYWHDLTPAGAPRQAAGKSTGHPLLGDRLSSPLHVYQSTISLGEMPWLSDHRIHGLALFPAAGFVELALAAARHALRDDKVALEGVSFREGLSIPDEGIVTLQVVVSPGSDGTHTVEVYSAQLDSSGGDESAAEQGEWRRHASAVAVAGAHDAPAMPTPQALEQARDEQDVESYYATLEDRGASYGPTFRGITRVARAGAELVGRAQLPPAAQAGAARMRLHPALLDACMQMTGVGLPWEDICVPVGLDRFEVFRAGASEATGYVAREPIRTDATGFRADVTLFDDQGVIAVLNGLEFRRVSRAALAGRTDAASFPDCFFDVEWPEVPPQPQAPIRSGSRWLVLSDGDELAAAIAGELSARGASVSRADHAETFAVHGRGWRLDTANPEHYRRLFKESASDDPRPWDGIVSLLGVERRHDEEELETLRSAHRVRIAAWLAAVPALADAGAPVWLATRGSQAVAGSIPSLAEAPAWGLGGVIAMENPGLRVVRIDLDPAERDGEAGLLVATLEAGDGETRVAFRKGQRRVARLTPGTVTATEAEPQRCLEIEERGVLDHLALRPAPRVAPGPGELEIRVVATGLNFRDVLNALGMYPGDPGPLGNECAGVVTAVGDGVQEFAPGDEVVTMIDRSFATYVVSPAALTVRKPSNLTFAEAATIPVTFLTADYALTELGRIKAGDRVLIHAATGGVGMAALQLARRAGAEIFATAGTPAKRALARALGAHHVGDSRSTSFVKEFERPSDDAGIDIVLNSLAGEFIPASLGLLRSGGRFIEIGKTDIWDAAAVANAFPDVEYHPLYLGEVTAAQPLMMRARLQRVYGGPLDRDADAAAADCLSDRAGARGLPVDGPGPPHRKNRHHPTIRSGGASRRYVSRHWRPWRPRSRLRARARREWSESSRAPGSTRTVGRGTLRDRGAGEGRGVGDGGSDGHRHFGRCRSIVRAYPHDAAAAARRPACGRGGR